MSASILGDMSTRIYNAYQVVDPATIWEVLHDIRIKARANISVVLKELYRDLARGIKEGSPGWKEFLKRHTDTPRERIWFVRDEVVRQMREQAGSMARNPFDFDVWVNVRRFGGDFYLHGGCDMMMRNVLDFLAEDARLVDFHYQNSTDKPDEISEEEWENRRDVWNDMIDEKGVGGWDDYLTLTICDMNRFVDVDPLIDMLGEPHD